MAAGVAPFAAPVAMAAAPVCTTTLSGGANIQTAVNAATAGDVICLNPGTYTPATAISINKSLTIIRTGCDPNLITARSAGNPATEAIIDGNSTTSIFSIANNVNNVTIACLEVTDGAGDLITSTDTGSVRTGIVIKNNIVHDSNGPGDEGIQLKRTNGAIIQYNDVYDVTGDGINISGNNTVNGQILDNRVHNVGSTDGAIYVYQSTNTTIDGNLLYNVSTNDAIKIGIKSGAEASTTPGGTVSNNVIVTGSQDAVSVYMSGVEVFGNKIKNSTSSNGGIYVAYASNNVNIHDNLVTDNARGIKIGGAAIPTNVVVNDNCIEGNTTFGMNVIAGATVNAENNWWGEATGPNTVGADTLTGNVAGADFTPFRTTGCHLEPIIDSNLDGIPDGADDPLSDTDSDGVPDASDNCPLDANADQVDTNSDGFGDVCSSTQTRVVTASALQNWVITPSDASVDATFETGPDTAPLGSGSIKLTTGADGDQYVIVHNGDFADTDLADITAMQYSTYVSDNQDAQAVYVSLRIDNNDDGIEDDRLYFEPVYQNGTYPTFPGATVPDQCATANCVELDTWQTWDLANGGWWSLTKNAGGPPLVTFESYINEFPEARIINAANGGIRLVAGAGAPSWNNFDGNVDNLIIQTAGDEIVYDFEPEPLGDTTAPNVPTHLSPVDGVVDTAANLTLIDWSTEADPSAPVTYVYQVATTTATDMDGAFSAPVYTSGPLTDSEIPTPGTPEGTYYWHVRAVDALGNASAWSSYWTITVDNTPPVCGDSVIESPEMCDDGNTDNNDGCDMSCQIELPPTCNALTATVYVQGGIIVGGPDNGLAYTGTLRGTLGADVIVGTDMNDDIDGRTGADTICAGAGHDVVEGDLGADTIFGEDGNDSIRGGAAADTIDGGNGVDYCAGGLGGATITNCEESSLTKGIIVINQITTPADAQDFAYTGLGGFTLDDDADGTWSDEFSISQNTGVFGADYVVTQDDVYGYMLSSLECSDTTNTTTDVFTKTANIRLNPGEVVTCSFSNEVDTIAPNVPTHVSPADGATMPSATLTMSDWTDETDPSGPVTYIYQSATDTTMNMDGDFVTPAYTSGPLATSDIAHGGTPEATYYWHVKAVDALGNESAWSPYWTITVDNTPALVCGNGVIEGGEQCDDGNLTNGDSCSSACQTEAMACVPTDTDLIANLKLDENVGAVTADDATANNNDGTVNGATSGAAGTTSLSFYNGGAYDFDGTDDSIDMGSNVGNFTLADSFTVSAWINPALDFDNNAIYGNTWSDAGYLLRVTADNKVRFILVENGSTYNGMDSNVLTPGWHHVVGTWDGTSVKVYVDGVEESITPIANGTVTTITSSANTFVGSTGQAGVEQFFDGTIDDLRIYDRALSLDEVNDLSGGDCEAVDPAAPVACVVTDDQLVAHWDFEENAGVTAEDTSANTNDGTLNGSTWSADTTTLTYDNMSAVAFDGADDYVDAGTDGSLAFDTGDTFSVSAWMKATSFSSYQTIAHKIDDTNDDRRGYLFTVNDGVPEVWIINDFDGGSYLRAVANTAVAAGAWHNVAFSYDGSSTAAGVKIYIDGVDVTGVAAMDALSGTIVNTQPFQIGFRSFVAAQAFNGSLDEVRVYSTVLSGTQVGELSGGQCDAGVLPPDTDTDDDLIDDIADNCPLIPNAGQENNDVDSEGDACDSDDDNDGVVDAIDNCDFFASSDQSDDDSDNVGNVCDPDYVPAPVTGLAAPTGNGSFRGNRTEALRAVVRFVVGYQMNGGGTDIAPGAFGGSADVPLSDAEIETICSVKEALPDYMNSTMREAFADYLGQLINRDGDVIMAALDNDDLCPQPVARGATPSVAAELSFPVSAAGYPVSSNATWNACITGRVTLEQIRANTDTDEDGLPRDCGSYHTANVWRHPDLGIYFQWNRKTKQITLPAGYTVEKDQVVTSN